MAESAICLARQKLIVELVDLDPDWRAVGAGLSLNSASLRAFDRVGVRGEIRAHGDVHAGLSNSTTAGPAVTISSSAPMVCAQKSELIFPEAAKPHFTGQGCWRAVFARPADMRTSAMFIDPYHKAGLNPVSRDKMYLFFMETVPENTWIPPENWPDMLKQRLPPSADSSRRCAKR